MFGIFNGSWLLIGNVSISCLHNYQKVANVYAKCHNNICKSGSIKIFWKIFVLKFHSYKNTTRLLYYIYKYWLQYIWIINNFFWKDQKYRFCQIKQVWRVRILLNLLKTVVYNLDSGIASCNRWWIQLQTYLFGEIV